MGHGCEHPSVICSPYDPSNPECRKLVPENTYLVTYAEVDQYMYSNQLCNMFKKFGNRANEITFRKSLYGYSTPISETHSKVPHVYMPYMQMPSLTLDPVLHLSNLPNSIFMSGIYKYPYTKPDGVGTVFPPSFDKSCEPLGFSFTEPLSAELLFNVYKESVYPEAIEVLELMEAKRRLSSQPLTFKDISDLFKRPMHTIMDLIGPGAYFFSSCRKTDAATAVEVYDTFKPMLDAHVKPRLKGTDDDEEFTAVFELFDKINDESLQKHKEKREVIKRRRAESIAQQDDMRSIISRSPPRVRMPVIKRVPPRATGGSGVSGEDTWTRGHGPSAAAHYFEPYGRGSAGKSRTSLSTTPASQHSYPMAARATPPPPPPSPSSRPFLMYPNKPLDLPRSRWSSSLPSHSSLPSYSSYETHTSLPNFSHPEVVVVDSDEDDDDESVVYMGRKSPSSGGVKRRTLSKRKRRQTTPKPKRRSQSRSRSVRRRRSSSRRAPARRTR